MPYFINKSYGNNIQQNHRRRNPLLQGGGKRQVLRISRYQPVGKGTYIGSAQTRSRLYFDLSDEDLAAMHVFAKQVARAIEKAFPCKKVGEAVIGLEVPHAHIHLIPIQKESDMLFSNPKLKLSERRIQV